MAAPRSVRPLRLKRLHLRKGCSMSLEITSSNKSFGGWTQHHSHHSETLNCAMRFAIYLPPQAANGHKVPVLYWLSGLTGNDENFIQKAGAQRLAAELGMALVAPDTRGTAISACMITCSMSCPI